MTATTSLLRHGRIPALAAAVATAASLTSCLDMGLGLDDSSYGTPSADFYISSGAYPDYWDYYNPYGYYGPGPGWSGPWWGSGPGPALPPPPVQRPQQPQRPVFPSRPVVSPSVRPGEMGLPTGKPVEPSGPVTLPSAVTPPTGASGTHGRR